MYKNNYTMERKTVCFRRFGNKGYSLFSVLGKVVLISTLSVATLTHASAESISTRVLPAIAEETDEDLTELADSGQVSGDQMLAELEVVGTRIPMSADKAVRLVQVLRREDIQRASAHSVNDLLKLVAGVDVRQRGAFGIQTDVGVNGGTQDQATVLLNGVNITSAHTGHLTMDLPVNIDEIERIEVIEGGASRVYGSNAFSGAINIVTKNAAQKDGVARLQAGSFGSIGGNASIGFATGALSHRISGAYNRSDGGTDNSDFKKSQAYYNGQWQSRLFDLRWQAGLSSMDYGANTFYSAKYNNQYEENSRIITSITGEYKGRIHIIPQIYWNESHDHYILNRLNPASYENFHRAETYGAQLSAWTAWALGKTSLGVEVRQEDILSSSLGRPLDESQWVQVSGRNAYYKNRDSRTNYNIYFEHDITLKDVSFSFGLLANKNTALDYPMHIYPGVDISWRPADGWRLYASFNQSLRMPTYTDLYYTGPNLQGNPDLKPERSTDFSVGGQWHQGGWSAQLKGFYRRGTDMIDWVKYSATDSNHAANIDLDYYGLDLVAGVNGIRQWGEQSWIKSMTLSYSYIYQNKKDVAQDIYSSSYAMDYLRHKLVMSLGHRICYKLEAQWDFILKSRNGNFDLYNLETKEYSQQKYGTHATLDLKLQWVDKAYTLYVQGNNLTSHRYYDISNVQLPGFWFTAGVVLKM